MPGVAARATARLAAGGGTAGAAAAVRISTLRIRRAATKLRHRQDQNQGFAKHHDRDQSTLRAAPRPAKSRTCARPGGGVCRRVAQHGASAGGRDSAPARPRQPLSSSAVRPRAPAGPEVDSTSLESVVWDGRRERCGERVHASLVLAAVVAILPGCATSLGATGTYAPLSPASAHLGIDIEGHVPLPRARHVIAGGYAAHLVQIHPATSSERAP